MEYKVSVVIPVYRVQDFIGRCVESLMKQTMKEVEYIFVNDATPDNSMIVLQSVLKSFPLRRDHVRMVEHEVNQGLPAARNTGLFMARGQYVFHCDSDDFVEPDMLEKMWEKAVETGADVVWSDWFLSFETKERYMKQPDYAFADEALKGTLSGAMKYNVWNKLVKRTLYIENSIIFPAGHGMGEDMTMIRLLACAEKVAYIPEAFYHYVKINSGAMTATWTERHLADLRYNVEQTLGFVLDKKGSTMDIYQAFFKQTVKLPFLISTSWSMYRLWQSWYGESDRFIWANKTVCLRTRLLQWMAWKGQFWYVWLYNCLIQRLVYTLLLGYR